MERVKAIVITVLSALMSWLGILAVPVFLLVGCNVIDYVTGLCAAKYRKDKKISSYKSIRGIIKKVCMWLLIVVGFFMDVLIQYAINTAGINLVIPFVVSTVPWSAYLKIAEGCDNYCAFCIIPYLRGHYRSRSMESLLAEAKKLSDAGVKELIVIAQDITRYGVDLYKKPMLAELLRELCKLDFHWIRLHYLYPDMITDELIDVMADNDKILNYLDIPIQHCNDKILKAMCRRGTKQQIVDLFAKLRERLPGLVLRTSLICGLPGEGEAEFEELCEFLEEQRIERAGVFQYSPEEGTRAAEMPDQVDPEVARRRVELVVDLQSRIMDEMNENRLGETLEVLCEGFDEEMGCYVGRSYADSVDIDGRVYFTCAGAVAPGTFVRVTVTDIVDGDLMGEFEEVVEL